MFRIRFASAIQSLGKHCFLPSLASRMIRLSKDGEIGKKIKRNNVSEGIRVKVNLNTTPRTPTNNMIINCIGIGADEEEGPN